MHVISKEQIKNRGYRNLKDVLQHIPGFGVFHRDLQFVGQVRGIAPNENEKLTFMINGHIVNQVTETEILNGPLNLDNVERIEIIVGPGSALYGPETLTAIVNIITKKIDGFETTLGIGNYQQLSGTIAGGRKWADDNYVYASLTGMKKNGWEAWDNYYKGKNTGALDPSMFLFAAAGYQDWRIQFSSYNLTMPELAIIRNSGGAEAKRHDYFDSFELKHSRDWTHAFTSEFHLSYDNKRMLRTLTGSPLQNNQSGGYSDNYDLHQKVYKANLAFNHKTPHNYLQFGLQFFYYQNRHNYVYVWDPLYPSADSVSKVNSIVKIKDHINIGLYVSDEYDLTNRLKITGAFRLDINTILPGNKLYLSPRIAMIYSPMDKWKTKIMYNRATRMPAPWMSPLNQYWTFEKLPAYIKNPLAEKPEILSAYEWQNIISFRQSRISLNMYYQEMLNYISWYRPFTNIGDFKGFGAELDFKTFINKYISVWANASYTDAEFSLKANDLGLSLAFRGENGEMLAVPKFTSNLGVDLKYKQLRFNPIIRYFTKQPAKKSADPGILYINNRYYFDGTFVYCDFLTDNLDVIVTCKNILNNTDIVSAQSFQQVYHPRGLNFEFILNYNF
jgi:outer membrane cobalamin receptor